MTLTKRIIPCLDVKNGRVVKGLHFESIKDAGDPVQLAKKYSDEGADELVFLDITASEEQRETIKSLVKKVAEVIDIPFTVGGGVKTLQHARDIWSITSSSDMFSWVVVNLYFSSFENKFVILEGNIEINPDTLCDSVFLNKNFNTKGSAILAILEDNTLICENNPNILCSMWYYRQSNL